jgi:hypothetical protein
LALPHVNNQSSLNGKVIMKLAQFALAFCRSRLVRSGNLPSIVVRASGCAVVGLFCLLSAFRAWSADCVTPPAGLVAWWPGEGNPNDILSANNGTLFGGVTFANGEVGHAFNFDGTSGYLQVPSSSNLNPAASFSIEGWIYPRQDRDQAIMSKWTDSPAQPNQRSYTFDTIPNGALYFAISDWAHQWDVTFQHFPTTNNAIRLNAWSHVAAVYDQLAGARRIYVNGIKVAERTDPPISVTNSTAKVAIGAEFESGPAALFFDGLIDELSFYSRALSGAEIQSIYNAGSAGKCTVALITSQPLSQTVNAGDNAVFSVAIAGAGAQFQWRFNGTNLLGQTNSTLSLNSIGTNQAGIYDVRVSLGTASVLSDPAELIVPLPGQPGSKKWQFTYGPGIHTTPALAKDGTIYVAATGALVALSPSGSQKWVLPLAGLLYGSPSVSEDGTIYVGAWGTSVLYAVNPNGTLRWYHSLPGAGGFTSPPSLAEDGTILVPLNGDPLIATQLSAVNTNGTPRWSFDAGGRPSGAAVAYDGTIYIGNVDTNQFFALHPDGSAKWRFMGIWNPTMPAIGADGTIYVGGVFDSTFRAFRPDGTMLWKYTASSSLIGIPAAIGTDGTIYFATVWDGKLSALNPNGTLTWVYDLGDRTYTAPAVSKQGTIYTSANEKRFLAISPSGTTQWEFVTGSQDINPNEGRRPNPTIAPDGTIYFPVNQPGERGVIFAIQGDSGPAESPWPMAFQNAQHSSRVPFAITNQPATQIVLGGSDAVFSVGVASTQPCVFQWRHNGTNMPNETNADLFLAGVSVGDEGAYSCLVSNRTGAFLSRSASLAVLHAATAIARVDNGFIVGATITDGGFGYTNTPVVKIIGGGGSGAQAVAVVSNGVVVAVNILDAGSGYTSTPSVVIDPPFIPNPVLDIAPMSFLSFSNLTVGGVYQLQQWVGWYWSNQPVSFTATNALYTQMIEGVAGSEDYRLALNPVPAQAFATALVSYGFVVQATVTSGGSGYVTSPAVSIVGAGGTNATAVSHISGGVVTSITIIDAGNGYTNAPTVRIAPPPAAAMSPTVSPVMRVDSADLAPYDNYQIQFKPDLGGPWGNWNAGLFSPTDVTNSQYLFITNGVGFFRLQYVP